MAIVLKNLTRFPAYCAAGGRAPLEIKILKPDPFQWLVQVVVKATYRLDAGRWSLDPEPLPIWERSREDEHGYVEGDLALEKGGVDLVVLGDSFAPAGIPVREMEVKLSIGSFVRALYVVGDRVWTHRHGEWQPSEPIPFRSMSLGYDRAFGGAYKLRDGNEIAYPANPIGKGWTPFIEGVQFEGRLLPNVEGVDQRVSSPEQEAEPMGFQWYRMEWARRLVKGVDISDEAGPPKPLPRLWNGAHPDLVLETYPVGSTVRVEGMTANGVFECMLPTLPVRLEHSLHGSSEALPAKVDTLCLFPAQARAYCVARWLIPFDAPEGEGPAQLELVPELAESAVGRT